MSKDFNLFSTKSSSCYLYDANTNTIHPWDFSINDEITQIIYESSNDDLKHIFSNNGGVNHNLLRYIERWRIWTDAFKKSPAFPMPHYNSIEEIPKSIRGKLWMSDLIIIPSEGCNFRCSYCTYSDNLYDNMRKHNNELMKWRTAKKAIDLFFEFNNELIFKGFSKRALNMVFYGGEPLLNWPVVRKGIEYASSIKKDHYKFMVSISTNLTLMKEEYLPFLRDNDVFINTSLDGPENEHNRYRHFANGDYTYNQIIDKLKMIRRFDEEYFNTYVKVIPTITGNTDAASVYEFFEVKNDYIPKLQTMSFLRDMDTCGFHDLYPYDKQKFAKSIEQVREGYVEKKIRGHKFVKGEFLYFFIDEILTTLYNTTHFLNSSRLWYTGTCFPSRKVAVNPDGRLHMCERMSDDYHIGDVDSGIDFQKVLSLVNIYFEHAPDCSSCWARNMCNICHALVSQDNTFDFGSRCNEVKKQVNANLKQLYTILEKNPSAFVGDFNHY